MWSGGLEYKRLYKTGNSYLNRTEVIINGVVFTIAESSEKVFLYTLNEKKMYRLVTTKGINELHFRASDCFYYLVRTKMTYKCLGKYTKEIFCNGDKFTWFQRLPKDRKNIVAEEVIREFINNGSIVERN